MRLRTAPWSEPILFCGAAHTGLLGLISDRNVLEGVGVVLQKATISKGPRVSNTHYKQIICVLCMVCKVPLLPVNRMAC